MVPASVLATDRFTESTVVIALQKKQSSHGGTERQKLTGTP
jgi:hypothetical protein